MNSIEVDKLISYIRKLKGLLTRIAREYRGEPGRIDAAVSLTNTIQEFVSRKSTHRDQLKESVDIVRTKQRRREPSSSSDEQETQKVKDIIERCRSTTTNLCSKLNNLFNVRFDESRVREHKKYLKEDSRNTHNLRKQTEVKSPSVRKSPKSQDRYQTRQAKEDLQDIAQLDQDILKLTRQINKYVRN